MRKAAWLLIGAVLVAALTVAALALNTAPETSTPRSEGVSLRLVAEGMR